MRVFRKMPQQYLVAGTLFLILGIWVRHLAQAGDASAETIDFFQASHGTLMVFFGIIPIFFIAVGYCLVPATAATTLPSLVDRLALVLFYMSACTAVIALETRSMVLFVFAMSLNLSFGIASAAGFIARRLYVRENAGKCTTVVFIGVSWWIIITYALLEYAAIRQLIVMWLAGGSLIYYEVVPNDVTVPLIWKHLVWFLGHPETIVFFTLIGGLVTDGVRNLFVRRIVA